MTDLTTILRRARPYVSGQYNGLTHPEALEVLDLIDRALIAAQHPSQSALPSEIHGLLCEGGTDVSFLAGLASQFPNGPIKSRLIAITERPSQSAGEPAGWQMRFRTSAECAVDPANRAWSGWKWASRKRIDQIKADKFFDVEERQVFTSPLPTIAQQEAGEPFVVRHYTEDEGPIIKGNGFDGLRIGNDREEAQAFIDWINSRIASPPPTDAARASGEAPIDMVLHCPACGMQHIDRPDPPSQYAGMDGTSNEWTCPPHRSQLCRPEDGGCGHIWRPADVPTNGVAAVKTKGKADSPIATPAEPDAARVEADRSMLREARDAIQALRMANERWGLTQARRDAVNKAIAAVGRIDAALAAERNNGIRPAGGEHA